MTALDWLERNFAALDREYAGRWVAITAQGVVAHGATLSEARRKALEAGVDTALFTCFGPGTWGREGGEMCAGEGCA